MGREEQIEEREVLDSIFPEEITDISDTSYYVSIVLDVDLHGEDGTELEPPSIILMVTYPEKYPDEAPILNITHPKDGSKPPHLFLPADTPQLLAELETTISDSLGAAMIFTLISTIKESAESLITSRVEAEQAEKDKEVAQAEEKENAKFHGEAVTRERFLAWREKFFEEQRAKEEEGKRAEEETGTRGKKAVREEKKMTGRELWEKGLVGKVDEDEGEGGERDALAAVEKLTVED